MAATPTVQHDLSSKSHKAWVQKPDHEAHKKALGEIEAKIEKLTKEQNAIKSKLSNIGGREVDPQDQRRKQVSERLAELRDAHNKSSRERSKIFEQESSIRTSLQKKINDLKHSQTKIPYKSAKEIDVKIKQNETKIESGTLKVIDEKRLLDETANLRRMRKVVETFQAQQKAIEADQAKLDSLRKKLDDPQAATLNEEYERLRDELGGIKKSQDARIKQRAALLDERTRIREKLDKAWDAKWALVNEFRKANNEYFAWQQEERRKRKEEEKMRSVAEEKQKLLERAHEELEEAEALAFNTEIKVCDVLLQYLQQFLAKRAATRDNVDDDAVAESAKSPSAREPRIEIPEGMVMIKSDPVEDMYYAPLKTKKRTNRKGRGNKQQQQQQQKESEVANGAKPWNAKIPLSVLERFFEVDVTPPSQQSEVGQAVEELKKRKQYYLDNQRRVTELNKQKVQEKIAKLEQQFNAHLSVNGITSN